YQAIDSGMDQVNHVQYIRRMMQPPPLADGTQPPFDIHAPAVQRAIAFLKAHHTVLDPTLASGEWILHPAREPVPAFDPGVLQAIQAATLVPARVMHLDTEVGTVTAGKRADLIVVDADPLQDVANLRKIWLVVARGRRFRPAPLWRSVGFEP